MEPKELILAIKEGFSQGVAALHNEQEDAEEADKKAFYVSPKKHKKHHDFVGSQILFFDWVRETVVKTVVRLLIIGTFGIFGLGLAVFFYLKGLGIIEKLVGG